MGTTEGTRRSVARSAGTTRWSGTISRRSARRGKRSNADAAGTRLLLLPPPSRRRVSLSRQTCPSRSSSSDQLAQSSGIRSASLKEATNSPIEMGSGRIYAQARNEATTPSTSSIFVFSLFLLLLVTFLHQQCERKWMYITAFSCKSMHFWCCPLCFLQSVRFSLAH